MTTSARHLIDAAALETMRDGVMLMNTSRSGPVDTAAVIEALKAGKVGSLGLDVCEEEESLFFADLSDPIVRDDVFSRLLTFPNVIVTGTRPSSPSRRWSRSPPSPWTTSPPSPPGAAAATKSPPLTSHCPTGE